MAQNKLELEIFVIKLTQKSIITLVNLTRMRIRKKPKAFFSTLYKRLGELQLSLNTL